MVVVLLTLWIRLGEPDPETQVDGATVRSYHLAEEEAKDLKVFPGATMMWSSWLGSWHFSLVPCFE